MTSDNSEYETTSVACPTSNYSIVVQSVRALYVMKQANYKDLATSVGVHPANVSKALSTATEIGLAKRIARGIFELTDAGKNFAQLLDINQDEKARNVLRETILKNSRWVTIIGMLRAAYGNPIRPVDIAADIERKLGKNWSTRARNDIAANIKAILEEARIARYENDGLIFIETVEDFKKPLHDDAQIAMKTYEATISRPSYPKDSGEYEELVTSHYQIRIKMNSSSIEKLQQQVKQGTILHQWLEDCESEIKTKGEDD